MKKKNIHFVGIKGVGMTPLAIIAKQAGHTVTGCDIDEEFITDESLAKADIKSLVGFLADHLKDVDLLITTGAHAGFDNPEVKAAKAENIPVLTQGQALGKFIDGSLLGRSYEGICVAGSHGKTTTTAMLATVLTDNGLDPSYVIGTSSIPSLHGPGHFGRGKYFVCEADEYATEPKHDLTPKFLNLKPTIAVVTNIELDHPDIYPSVEDVRNAFLSFASLVMPEGTLVVNGDDLQVRKLLKDYRGKVITFGFSGENYFVLKHVSVSEGQTFFWVDAYGTDLGEFALSVSGEHNALNAVAVVIACIELGLDVDHIKKSLLKFTGSKRRLELIKKFDSGASLYDDYAHHPTEIKRTLKTLRQSYPKSKIICVFQPHTYSRTKALFEEFVHAFYDCNELILTDIYPSHREQKDESGLGAKLASAIEKYGTLVKFIPDMSSVVEYINQKQKNPNTIVVTMGAGDIYKVISKVQS